MYSNETIYNIVGIKTKHVLTQETNNLRVKKQ